jgi:hypothetical protein
VLREDKGGIRLDNAVRRAGWRDGARLTIDELPAAVTRPDDKLIDRHVMWRLPAHRCAHHRVA